MLTLITNSKKILGMNARNLNYIRPYNLRRAREIADDKLLSKKVLTKGKVPVPHLIAKIPTQKELDNFDWSILPASFVLKPNRGFGGGGIIVVYAKKKGRDDAWIKADGSLITIEDLKSHINNIIEGAFSLSNAPDVAFFEERLKITKDLKTYAYKGVPDVRVIIYNKVPVMAMLRLPTKDSDGKANLHQGAIGVGIDLATGTTTSAVQGKGRLVEYIPGTRLLLSGIKIPYWDDILQLAVKAQEVSGLGYLGADVAIDRERGPVFLELNARPGLAIQVANLAGLKGRLQRVMGLKIKSSIRGIAVGKNLFGGEIEEEVESVSGKKVIGSIEKVTLIGKKEEEVEVEAKIDTGAYSTSIDHELARTLGFGDTLDVFSQIDLSHYDIVPEKESEIKKDILAQYGKTIPGLADVAVVFASSGASIRPVIKTTFIMDKKRVVAKMNIVDRSNLKYPMIVGKRNLGRFLVDVSK